MPDNWSIYLIRCHDQSYYTGISNNVQKRFEVHQSGQSQSCKYTRSRRPLELVFQAEVGNRSQATKLELKVKKLRKTQKEALIKGQLQLKDI